MKKILSLIAVLLLVGTVAYAGSDFNHNRTEPTFNARKVVTKTTSYTATFSDSYIKVNNTAAAVITLPAISTVNANGYQRYAYKISKISSNPFLVTVTPNGSDTIDGTTGYVVANANDFIIISSDSTSTNWDVSYADDILDTNVATGAITVGGAMTINNQATETTTATDVLTGSQCGSTLFFNSATEYLTTLPTPSAGCYFKIIVKAAPASASYTVATNASANILIGGINELEVDTSDDGPYIANGDLITFADGVAVVGDYVEFISDGTSWYIQGQANADGGITLGST